MANRAEQLNDKGYQYLKEKDYVSAYKYFLEAARLGNAHAIYNLGFCYFNGYGVAKNAGKAMKLLTKVALEPCSVQTQAQYLCGLIEHDNNPDLESARLWYEMAAESGHAWAKLQLGRTYLKENELIAEQYIKDAMRAAPNDYQLQNEAKKLSKFIKFIKFGCYF